MKRIGEEEEDGREKIIRIERSWRSRCNIGYN
jgi:hypothetical protein